MQFTTHSVLLDLKLQTLNPITVSLGPCGVIALRVPKTNKGSQENLQLAVFLLRNFRFSSTVRRGITHISDTLLHMVEKRERREGEPKPL